MQDRVAAYPGRVRMTPVAGQTNVYDMELADSPSVVGTPLNKANLLTDATAALLGLTSSATVNTALAQIPALISSVQTTLQNSINSTKNLLQTAIDELDNDFNAFSTALGVTSITLVSRAGTGGYGSSANPLKITFPFAPKVVILYGSTMNSANGYGWYNAFSVIEMSTLTTSFKSRHGWIVGDQLGSVGSGIYASKTSDEKTIKWYGGSSSAGDAHLVANASGYTYYYIAIA